METKEHVKVFSESFFRNLGANVKWSNEVLIIDSVPREFEEFCEKKSPYYLIFDNSMQGRIENAELMVKGSYLLQAMTEYLENRGQTALLKINFDFDPKDLLNGGKFVLKNVEAINANKKEKYEVLLRFSFITNFQYLNEKEQIVTHVYVKNGEVIDFDENKYKFIEGKKEEISATNTKEAYELAKKRVREVLDKKTNEVSGELEIRLEKELQRVKAHYGNQLKEIEDEIRNGLQSIEEMKREILKPNRDSKDVRNFENKIKRVEERLSEIQNTQQIEKLKKEEEFFLNDEMHKHSLNVNTKLINSAIIYYPLFKFEFSLKGKGGYGNLEIEYDPLKDETSKVLCHSCKKEINSLLLCSMGHVFCGDCLGRCGDCLGDVCKVCSDKSCAVCDMKLCRKCVRRCNSCSKNICKMHSRKNPDGFGDVCSNCLKNCPKCGVEISKSRLKKNSLGVMVCEKCLLKDKAQRNINLAMRRD